MKSKANVDIRELEKTFGVAQWQVAAKLGISESTLIKRMRFELCPDEKAKVCTAIDDLKEG